MSRLSHEHPEDWEERLSEMEDAADQAREDVTRDLDAEAKAEEKATPGDWIEDDQREDIHNQRAEAWWDLFRQ